MNCLSCTAEDAQKRRTLALAFLKTPGEVPEADRDKAIACCECYADMMVKAATEKHGYETTA